MLLVREHLVLQRQKRATGVDEVEAGQVVLQRDFLRAQMFLHGHREVSAALDGGIVRDNQHLDTIDPADAGYHAGTRRRIVVHAVSGERREFKKRRTRVEQGADAFARQQLAAVGVPGACLVTAAERGLGHLGAPFVDGHAQLRRIGLEVRTAGINLTVDGRHAGFRFGFSHMKTWRGDLRKPRVRRAGHKRNRPRVAAGASFNDK